MGGFFNSTVHCHRIKANVTGPPLVVVVEAQAAPPGAHAQPLQLRAGTRGAQDPPYTVSAGHILRSGPFPPSFTAFRWVVGNGDKNVETIYLSIFFI